MPKVGAAKPKKKTTPKKKKSAKVKDFTDGDPALFMSDDDEEQQEAMVIMGEIGSGKTYCAATASDFWPRSLPSKKWVTLEDMFWFQTDRKATAGFRGDRIKVATFDIFRFMSKPEVFGAKPYEFKDPPSWGDAVEVGVNKVYDFVDNCIDKGLRPKIVLDTLTGFDSGQYRRARQEAEDIESEPGVKHNSYRPFNIHGVWHEDFFWDIINSGADCIFLCHQKGATQTKTPGKITVKVAGMEADFVPDLYGDVGKKLYKRHTTMQLIMRAYAVKERGRNKLVREILIGINDFGGEAKNRYERALAPLGGRMSPPDLGKILEMVSA